MNKLSFAAPAAIAALVFCAPAAAIAQPVETASWTVSAPAALKPGSKTVITLQGAVQDGWHLYALKQAPDGPTPLLVSIEKNGVATANGVVTGSAPQKVRDPAFGLDTQFYAQAFTLMVPVRLKDNLKPGPQAIPLSVRFQTCNGAVCQPPKTVHLSAAITVQAVQ